MDWLSIAIATALSGLFATLVTLFVQKKSEEKRVKIQIFETLMSHRYRMADKENVEELNKISVIFHNSQRVRTAWDEFIKTVNIQNVGPEILNKSIGEKYTKLLEEIGKSIGYKDVSWEDINHFYFPTGLATELSEEELLRKAQLSQLSTEKQNQESSQLTNEQFAMQLLLKSIEHPESLSGLLEIAKIGSRKK